MKCFDRKLNNEKHEAVIPRPYSEAKKAYKNDQLSLPGNFISVTTEHTTQVNHTLKAPVGSTFPAHPRVDWLENTEPGVGPLPLTQGR